ncbi:MAG: hypothetical protein GC151_16505 [Betaproteobacteria bacterium]|nr:hypothetical protein [Betaproteobacteria bacterium]
MEPLAQTLLRPWFAALNTDYPAWNHSTLPGNQERPFEEGIARRFLAAVIAQPTPTSDERSGVDGTLIEAWASNTSV